MVFKFVATDVNKSVKGKAGSLNGYFTDEIFGSLTKNTANGIYGTTNDNYQPDNNKVDIAEQNEIKTGYAQVFTTIIGDKPKLYDIEITKICNTSKKSNENFVIFSVLKY
jgi:stage IV sporulation protein B